MFRPEPSIIRFRRSNYTQEQLAEVAGISSRSVARIEAGEAVASWLIAAYFKALNVDLVQRVRKPSRDADHDATLEDVRGYR